MALTTVSSDRLSTNVKNTNFTAAEKQDLTNDILPLASQFGQSKNLVTNGAMRVSQRGTSFATVSNNETTIDQFALTHPYGSSQMSISQSTTSPDGFSNSYKLDVNTADTSIGAGQYVAIRHRIEAQNLQQLAFGTSSAKSISLSFYVRSNVTGTYAVNIQQTDNSKKQVSATYTINSANTWERKTFTFAGDTSGVINNDTGDGFEMLFYLAAGSNRNSGTARSTFTAYNQADEAAGQTANILSSTSNEFYFTGVQLEASSVVTEFEHKSLSDDLMRCFRYYQLVALGSEGTGGTNVPLVSGAMYGGTTFYGVYDLKTRMRSAPTMESVTGTDYYKVYRGSSNDNCDEISVNNLSPMQCTIRMSGNLSGTSGDAGWARTNHASAFAAFTAEL